MRPGGGCGLHDLVTDVASIGSEVGESRKGRRTQAGLLAIAIAVGGLLAALAPADWPDGEATVTLSYLGEQVVAAPVVVGDKEPVTLDAAAASLGFQLDLPSGVSDRDPIAATIAVRNEAGEPVRPDLAAVELRVTLADGRSELIPATRWDEAEGRLEAARRPTEGAAVVLGLLGAVVVLWVTEAFPLFVTSLLIPFVLVVAGIAPAGDATSPFFNPIIVLFFAGFLMAEAMQRTRLDHYVSVAITARAGGNPATLFGTMLALTAFLSMWMSNTAATAVLIPIALAVTEPLGEKGYQRAVILGIAYAATLGGVGSAIGTPANQLAIELLDEFGGRSISFVGWFGYGLPMVVLFLPVIGLFLWWRSRIRVDTRAFVAAREIAEEERRSLGRFDRDQLTVLAVFALVAGGWLTQTFHGVHAGIVALGGAVLLFMLGKLRTEDLGTISWPALITFGGGLTLGLFLVRTGTSDYVATRLTGLAGVATLAAILAVALVTLLLTTVASNTASAAILIPLAIPLAGVLGIEPTTLVVVVAIASSVDFALVIGTPPTMIAYSTRLFTAGQIFRTGILLDLAGIAVLVFAVTRVWEFLGLA